MNFPSLRFHSSSHILHINGLWKTKEKEEKLKLRVSQTAVEPPADQNGSVPASGRQAVGGLCGTVLRIPRWNGTFRASERLLPGKVLVLLHMCERPGQEAMVPPSF